MIMQAWKEYQEKNKDRFLDELLELLRIPSVSANSENKEDMRKCAEKVQQRLLEAGARGYLLKNVNDTELLQAIRTVYGGKMYFSNEVSEKLSSLVIKQQKKLPIDCTGSSINKHVS